MLKIFKKIYAELNYKIKIEFIILIFLTCITSVFETITISLMIPLINILVNSKSNTEIYNNFLNFLFSDVDVNDFKIISFLFIISIILTTFFRLKLMWGTINISNKIATEISSKIYKMTLYQPFINHVGQGSSKIISAMSQKVSIVANVMMSCTTAITSLMILISILIVLLFNNALLTIISIICFVIAYITIYLISKKKLKHNSKIIADKFTENIKSIQEGLGSLRDILLGSYQKLYLENYRKSFFRLQHVSGQNNFISQSPRFLLESFGMILIIIIALSISLYGNDKAILASIGLLTIGAQRMLPLFQQIYTSIANIVGNKQNILDVYDLIYKNNIKYETDDISKIKFETNINLKNISFNYIKGKNIIENINLKIDKGSKIGIIGPTGSGKSTFLDILMGFLLPTTGIIKVDDIVLNEKTVNSWKNKIALVPQNIFLSSSSIMENIIFGKPYEKKYEEFLNNILEICDLKNFVMEKKEGLNFHIEERGVNLSGGQKQRIGIARALFKDKDLLFMDEATNALDENTEKKLLNNIFNYKKNLTIFISTHNKNNLKLCDRIIEFKAKNILIK